LLDRAELVSDITSLQKSVDDILTSIVKTRTSNVIAAAHNSKAEVIRSQMSDMRAELFGLSASLVEEVDELSKLQILVKAFSTTGLVAYKIECLVKDLEEITNQYLGVLAAGRFQLAFKIAGADKLNVVITDNGTDVSIEALSSGERARVNISTLLAIRKLMQALSNSRTNLLILDETISSLDPYGKEKLIEVLLEESDLNTILVAHDFEHPLLEKVHVVKSDNISRLE
jgi:DNA repair exonuclease SbcCD ATPase subunit